MAYEPLTDRQHRRVREPIERTVILGDMAQCGIGPHFLGCTEFVGVGHLASLFQWGPSAAYAAQPTVSGAYLLGPSVDATASCSVTCQLLAMRAPCVAR